MSDIGDLPKHTFLSRVFGVNQSSKEGANSRPLFNDDTQENNFGLDGFDESYPQDNDSGFTSHAFQSHTSIHSTESSDETDDEETGDAAHIDVSKLKAKNTVVKVANTKRPTDSESAGKSKLETRRKDDHVQSNQVPKNRLGQNRIPTSETEIESESEAEPGIHSEEDEEEEEEEEEGIFRYNPQKEAIRKQLQSQFEEDNMVDLVPESLLLGNGNASESRTTHPSFRERLGRSIMEGIKETEESIGPSLSQMRSKVRTFAKNKLPKMSAIQQSYRRLPSENNTLDEVEMNGFGNSRARGNASSQRANGLAGKIPILSPMERALWIWANVTNLDLFFLDVYQYYTGNGFQCILLKRLSEMGVVVFIVVLTSYMGNCVDYSKLLSGKATKLSEVTIAQCHTKMGSGQKMLYIALFAIFSVRAFNGYRKLREYKGIKLFYNYLLGISDDELQTIGWPEIVRKIMILRDQNTNAVVSGNTAVDDNMETTDLSSKKKLSAHDIANRLMRKDNYMIALFNKDILAQQLKIPGLNTYFLTKTMEWNLKLCIFDYLFDSEGQLKTSVMDEHSRLKMSQQLSKRFQLAGMLSVIITPPLVLYFLLYYFLRFFYQFKSDPGSMSTREFSPYAYWKLREFNELPHIFRKRLRLSVEGSNAYLNQFPKEKMDIVLRFVSFISGSFVALLACLTVLGHENFLNFELTEGRTVLFYMSAFGTLFTICRSALSDVNSVFDPEASLRYVAQFTHYLPRSWEGRYHSEAVRSEFCKLFNLKIVLVLKEIASLIMLPYFLYFRLPSASKRIVDFFREFSVHVDNIGYVCSFATFHFDNADRPTNIYLGKSDKWDKDNVINDYYASNDNKMVRSYLYFLESYGNGNLVGNHSKAPKLQHEIPSLAINSKKHNVSKDDGNNANAHFVNTNIPVQAQYQATTSSQNIHHRLSPGKQQVTAASIYSSGYPDQLEETTAGLSPDTKHYLKNMSNSYLLGDSFENSNTDYSHNHNNNGKGKLKNSGGVLALLNGVYKQPDKRAEPL
ncbi:ATG9 [Brettanomyces bruxellensis]|uniref:Autophagy-related protein 9 n=1 Tax=Dekkera bruxellensis TaxID=5007 RepID=A0A7D9CY37_DEKBR|nr:ATG9 [Brettanomyces bruxellensis]